MASVRQCIKHRRAVAGFFLDVYVGLSAKDAVQLFRKSAQSLFLQETDVVSDQLPRHGFNDVRLTAYTSVQNEFQEWLYQENFGSV